jgi:hypothetical protein
VFTSGCTSLIRPLFVSRHTICFCVYLFWHPSSFALMFLLVDYLRRYSLCLLKSRKWRIGSHNTFRRIRAKIKRGLSLVLVQGVVTAKEYRPESEVPQFPLSSLLEKNYLYITNLRFHFPLSYPWNPGYDDVHDMICWLFVLWVLIIVSRVHNKNT